LADKVLLGQMNAHPSGDVSGENAAYPLVADSGAYTAGGPGGQVEQLASSARMVVSQGIPHKWRDVGWTAITEDHVGILMPIRFTGSFAQTGLHEIFSHHSHYDRASVGHLAIGWLESGGTLQAGIHVLNSGTPDTWSTSQGGFDTGIAPADFDWQWVFLELDFAASPREAKIWFADQDGAWTQMGSTVANNTWVTAKSNHKTPFSPHVWARSTKSLGPTNSEFASISGWERDSAFALGFMAVDEDLSSIDCTILVPDGDISADGTWAAHLPDTSGDLYTCIDNFKDSNICGVDYIKHTGSVSADEDVWFTLTDIEGTSITIYGVWIAVISEWRDFQSPVHDYYAPDVLLVRDNGDTAASDIGEFNIYGHGHVTQGDQTEEVFRHQHMSGAGQTHAFYIFLPFHPKSSGTTVWTEALINDLEIGFRFEDGSNDDDVGDEVRVHAVGVYPVGYGFTEIDPYAAGVCPVPGGLRRLGHVI
jgi:hypothetical protein